MPLVRMPDAYQAIVRINPKEPRYAPLEVAGAAAMDFSPVNFRTAKKYSRELLHMIGHIKPKCGLRAQPL